MKGPKKEFIHSKQKVITVKTSDNEHVGVLLFHRLFTRL